MSLCYIDWRVNSDLLLWNCSKKSLYPSFPMFNVMKLDVLIWEVIGNEISTKGLLKFCFAGVASERKFDALALPKPPVSTGNCLGSFLICISCKSSYLNLVVDSFNSGDFRSYSPDGLGLLIG